MEDLPILSALRVRLGATPVGLGFGSSPSRRGEPDIPQVQQQDISFLGPHAIAMFISGMEMGIIIACFARFIARSDKEKTRIKVLIYFLTFVAALQTGATFAAWWKISVVDYGNWGAAAVPAWPQKIHSSLTTVIAAPVQLFLIWRCWHLLKQRLVIAVPLIFLVFCTIVSTGYVTAILFLIQFKSTNTKAVSLATFYTSYLLSVSISAAIDIAVTSILLVFLIKSRSRIHTRQFRKVLSQLITITWESAVPPCACAIAAFIACIASRPFISYWSVMLQVILGKLYLISLFVTLEGRAKLVTFANLTHFPTLTNVTRRDNTWPDLQTDRVEAGGRDSTKQSDLPLAFVPFKGPMTASNDASAEEGSMTRGPNSSYVEMV